MWQIVGEIGSVPRFRHKTVWKYDKARSCQLVQERNKAKRLAVCLKTLPGKDSLSNVLYTDETTVQIELYARFWLHLDFYLEVFVKWCSGNYVLIFVVFLGKIPLNRLFDSW